MLEQAGAGRQSMKTRRAIAIRRSGVIRLLSTVIMFPVGSRLLNGLQCLSRPVNNAARDVKPAQPDEIAMAQRRGHATMTWPSH